MLTLYQAGLTAYVGLVLTSVLKYGAGRHQWDLSLLNASRILFVSFQLRHCRQNPLANASKYANICETVYTATVFFAKLSILLQMLALFGGNRKGTIYWVVHVSIWINFAFYFASAFAIIFSCIPRERIWNPLINGSCINVYGLIISSGALNCLSNLSMLILPIAVIFRLQMELKKKLGICAVFAFGLVSVGNEPRV